MKTCQTKKCAWMRTPLMVVSVTYTSMALALAYNDVTAWWHLIVMPIRMSERICQKSVTNAIGAHQR